MMRRMIAILLAVLLSAGMMPMVLAENILPQQEHADAPMEQVAQLSFSMDSFRSLKTELESACQDESRKEQVSNDLAELKEMYLSLDTLLSWYYIAAYRDVNDQEANDLYGEYMDAYYQMDEELSALMETILDSPCSECVDPEDPVFSQYTGGSYAYTEEELALYDEEQALTDSYYDAAAGTFTALYQGTDMTYDEIVTAYYSNELDYDTAEKLINEVQRTENDALAGIYLQLVENRNAQAELCGYDNAADYYDEGTYYRDYSEREREEFYEAVKNYIVPLIIPVENRINRLLTSGAVEDTGYSTEELLSMLQTGLENVSEELLPAYKYMTEKDCCDLGYSEVKADMSFTMILSEPNAPYLLMEPCQQDYDFTALVHEFGHYNAYFCAENTFYNNIDLAEIHSQGLELLMLKNYPMLFGEKSEYEALETIYQRLYSLVDGCMIDEFERYAYSEENLTAEKLNAEYLKLEQEYGEAEEDDPSEGAYDWVEIPHLFSSPMYYLSYGVSAAAAFEIWECSETDYNAALTTYLSLVKQGEGDTYFNTLETVGMDNPMTEEALEAFSNALCTAYGLQPGERSYEEVTDEEVLAAVEVFLSVAILGGILIGIRVRRRRKMRTR